MQDKTKTESVIKLDAKEKKDSSGSNPSSTSSMPFNISDSQKPLVIGGVIAVVVLALIGMLCMCCMLASY